MMKINWKTILLLISVLAMLAGCSAKYVAFSAAGYIGKGKYDEAIETAKQAIEMDPKLPDGYRWLGDALNKKERWHEAISAYKKAIALAPYDPSKSGYLTTSFSYSGLAEAYFKTGQIDEAYAAAKRSLEVWDSNHKAPPLLKEIEERQKEILKEKAIVKVEKESAELYNAINQGNFGEAVTDLKRKRTELSKLAWAYNAGNLLCGMCDPDGAIKFYKQGMEADLDEAEKKYLSRGLCLAYSLKKNAAGVKEYCQEFNSIGADIKFQYSNIYIHSVKPNTPAAKAGLAPNDQILQVAGVPVSDTDQYFSLIKKADPGGRLVFKIRRGKQEIEKIVTVGSLLKNTASINQAYCRAQALNREGVALARQGKNTAALAKFQEALKTAPGPLAKAEFNAALVLEQKGRPREAVSHYIKARDNFLLPEDETGATNKLVALAVRARFPVPETADRKYRIGILRAKQKRYEDAIKEFEAALAEAPWMVSAYYNLGLVYDYNKDYFNALRVLRTYAKLAPDSPNMGPVKSKIVELEDRLGLLEGSQKRKEAGSSGDKQKPETTKGYMGVIVENPTPALRQKFGLPPSATAFVVFVQKRSPADKAGLKALDAIVRFDGNHVMNRAHLLKLLEETTTGQTVSLTILRRGQPMELYIQLGVIKDMLWKTKYHLI